MTETAETVADVGSLDRTIEKGASPGEVERAAIRRDARLEGLSIRELAARHGVHRRTVRQALADAVPPPRRP